MSVGGPIINNSAPDCAPDGKNVFAPGIGYEEPAKSRRGKAFALAIPGIILSVILLKFSGGILIFSAISSIVMLAGFAMLWKENAWFKACAVLAALQVLWCGFLLLGLDVAYAWVYNQTNLAWHAMHLANIALFFCLWKGMELKKEGVLNLVLVLAGYGALIGLGYAGAGEIIVVCKAVAALVCALSLSWMQKLAKE